MALIKCEKCGEQISDKAKRCPHCGKSFQVGKIKDKRKKIFKLILLIISIIVCFIVCGLGIFLLINQVIGIPKLNYPLTSIIPILTICSAVGFSVIFTIGMFKWKKEKSAKKYFKISLILLISCIVLWFIASPINTAIQKNEIGYRNQGNSTYFVKGFSYDIPNKWRTEEANGGYYHYPYVENSDGLLYVYSEYDNSYNYYDYDTYEEYYESFIDGMKSSDSTGYFKIISKDSVKIANKDGFKLRYKTIIDNKFFECEQYMLLDAETNTMYAFTFGIKDSIPQDIDSQINTIMNSVKER